MKSILKFAAILLMFSARMPAQRTNDPYLTLMQRAQAYGSAHGAKNRPTLSPVDASLLEPGARVNVNVATLHSAGFKVVSWTTNDAEKIRAQIALGVDGIISDRPDILRQVVEEERKAGKPLTGFDISAHRGGRGLRPENTLPSFENGMDQGATTLETDTGVTTDHVSLIWHDQFLNPESCRRQDGKPYTMDNRVYINTISMPEAQKTFICDNLHSAAFPDQKNDLSLSPVAVAFAKKEGLLSPYVPTNAEQLFRFVRFYTEYYKTGAGRNGPHAAERAHTPAQLFVFNLETKILPDRLPAAVAGKQDANVPADLYQNHTFGPEIFVQTLCGAVMRNHMESRSEIQSFDFRTLQLTEAQYPLLPTYYLTNNIALLSSEMAPESLRLTADEAK